MEENKIDYDRIFEELENRKEKIHEEIDERINELVFIRSIMNIGTKYRKFIEDIVDKYRKIYHVLYMIYGIRKSTIYHI